MREETPQPCPGFLDIGKAARWASVSEKTISRWLGRGLQFYQEGQRTKILIRPTDLEEFLTRRQAPKSNLDDMVDTVMSELKAEITKG